MAVKLAPRYLEVLTILRDSIDGLTTPQILEAARTSKGTTLKDSTVVSYVVNVLREDKRFVASNGGLNGIVHRITPLGLKQFDIEEPHKAVPVEQPQSASPTKQFHKAVRVEQPQSATPTEQFHKAVEVLISSLTRKEIANKLAKHAVLTRLELIVNEEIAQLLREIKEDLS